MIHSIKFNKEYSVEPIISTTNPLAITKKYKINRGERGWIKDGKNIGIYTYIPLFKKGLKIDFKKRVNIIVGDNGTGKTQLFKIIKDRLSENSHSYPIDCTLDVDNDTEFIVLDLVNGLIKDIIKPKPWADSKRFIDDSLCILDNSIKSHGESVKQVFDIVSKIENKTIFLDEPESGLSIKAQVELINKIKELSKSNQLIIITHSKFLIDSFEEVYYFDEHRWIETSELYKKLEI